MKRVQTPRSAAGPVSFGRAIACAGVLVAPGVAVASEGELVLLPELPPFLSGLAEALGFPVGWRLFSLLILFPLLVPFVNALIIKPLLRVLDERDARIAGTRTKAERLEQEAAAILARYEQAVRDTREEGERGRRSLLSEVRAEAQREIAAARRDAEGRLEAARGEIAASLESARASLRGQAQDLASQAASQVLGRAL